MKATTFKVKIQINQKFSNGCQWYKDGDIYEVEKCFGAYSVVDYNNYGIHIHDAIIIENI